MDGKKTLCDPYHGQKAHKLMNYNEKKDEKCNEKEIDKFLYSRKLKMEKPRTTKKSASQSEAEWDENFQLAKITKFANNITKNFAHSWNKAIYLYPEECLFLLEKNNLILRWNGNELSFQNAFIQLLAEGSNCTFNQFKTYSYLKKMGFRVFKFDKTLIRKNVSLPNLTKIPEKSLRIKDNVKNKTKFRRKNTHPVNSCLGNNESFPIIPGTNWVVVTTPPQYYLPHNLQPSNNVYMFNITKTPQNMKITAMLSDYYSENYIKKPFIEKESIVYESPTTGMYPVYEKNIPKREKLKVKSVEENIYEPKGKKLKILNTNKDHLSAAVKMTSTLSKDLNEEETIEIRNINTITSSSVVNADVTNTETDYSISEQDKAESSKAVTKNKGFSIESTIPSHIREKLFAIKETREELKVKSVEENIYEPKEKKLKILNTNKDHLSAAVNMTSTLNVTNTETDYSISEQDKAESSKAVTKNKGFSIESTIPSHIREKLFAIKETKVKYEIDTNTDYSISYDVYYPNNHFPKKKRPVPDFRVIVFEDNLNNFPNIHDVNVSNPHDNVPTLWAIVNLSDVSFYNVNNIVLPKPTDWKPIE
ncbi:tRNA-splicing endonuclease, subunit Sen54, N-terminal [Cinara cedri]|uniref:tRNA-splicing endonuclease, subunit Sen54, N-terminal n=1 Tax=Cinara cedri TaxID=506608 RepID=A0A5E4NL05_9HEMI|nr:tRNA-splicing endonuclease, subunit Sen54, N-terminal [Cinara cedri]